MNLENASVSAEQRQGIQRDNTESQSLSGGREEIPISGSWQQRKILWPGDLIVAARGGLGVKGNYYLEWLLYGI